MSYLELSHVQKSFGPVKVVHDFNMSIEEGEFVSFLGPSGCGKTTVLRMIAGFETPTGGTITIGGVNQNGLKPNKRNIGMVFQAYALFPNMTVAQNVAFGLKVAGASKAEIDARVKEMLDLIHLGHLADRYPYQMSGGQQQRVALARALANKPKVLLLDEPLSALDAKIRVSLREEIRAIQRKLGITTIFVTHDQEEALSISDRIVVMNAGIADQIGTPSDIYNRRPRASSRVLSARSTFWKPRWKTAMPAPSASAAAASAFRLRSSTVRVMARRLPWRCARKRCRSPSPPPPTSLSTAA